MKDHCITSTRHWVRTSDLLGVNEALSQTELGGLGASARTLNLTEASALASDERD